MLTIEQKNELLLAFNGSKDYKLKTRISAILLRDKGLSYRQIAYELGVTNKIPHRWINRWKENPCLESLQNKPCRLPGNPRKLSPEAKRFLIKKATQAIPGKGSEGKTWLLKELASELRKETGVKLSLFHIFKVLRDNGISLDRRDSVYTPSGQDS